MDQTITGPVRSVARGRGRTLHKAICRRTAGALILAAGIFACQPGTEPIGDNRTGTITVSVSGLPNGSPAAITVSGPGGYQRTLTASETLADLGLGTYTITAASVIAQGDGFAPAPASQNLALTSANPAGSVTVAYAATTGRLQVTITGVPAGSSAAVAVSGPGGYSRIVTVSELVTGLSPGEYTVTSSLITSDGLTYLATPSSQAVAVAAGATATANVTYSATTGSLGVTIAGLPAGTPAQVTVTGPEGFSRVLTESQFLSGLAPGLYTLDAAPVTSGGVTYAPSPLLQTKTVYAGQHTGAAVSYAPSNGSGLDLRVEAVYLTQATQRLDGSVPLVAGRDAYLRGFAVASGNNAAQPALRVRLYQGSTLVQTYTLPAPGTSVPTAAEESSLANSWNVLVPGALVQPGLAVVAEVDPANAVAELDENNNQFPASGVPALVDVRPLPTFAVRLVPVLQQVNGLQGNVTSANLETFLNDLKQVLPVGAYDADLRDVYTTTAPALQGNNANNAWNTVLAELLALRSADASTRYYYGVVKVSYSSGTAGLGYVGGGARTAVGWDYLPSGSRVMAHEVGHNMGRWHAPCGSVAGPDPNYPHPGGVIGAWGLSLNGLALKPPSTADLMGYCQPVWVSDYNWSAMVAYRESGPNNAPEGAAGRQDGPTASAPAEAPGLLLWGRVTPEGIVLEPSFRVPFSPALMPRAGPHLVELIRADGRVLRAARFEAPELADLPGPPERHFAFVLPLGAEPDALAGMRVRIDGRTVERRRPAVGAEDPRPAVTRVGSDRISVRWDDSRYPMVLVRDPATGRVLSFARNGDATVWSRATEVELQFSDGVRATTRRERVLR